MQIPITRINVNGRPLHQSGCRQRGAKPCPFCGNPDLMGDDGQIECPNCGAKGPDDLHKAQGTDLARWNCRSAPQKRAKWPKKKAVKQSATEWSDPDELADEGD